MNRYVLSYRPAGYGPSFGPDFEEQEAAFETDDEAVAWAKGLPMSGYEMILTVNDVIIWVQD